MVYGTVQRHGGEIEVLSEVGRGTTIRIFFPEATKATTMVDGASLALRPLSPLRILLVDDDPILLRSLRDILVADGHTIVTADGGPKGLEAFRDAEQGGQPFSVLITDLGMPHMDGRRLATAVKAIKPDTPIILLTGWGHRMLAETDRPENVDRVLSKPPSVARLRSALAELTSTRT
jgi:CheY-like chemotaxis protein